MKRNVNLMVIIILFVGTSTGKQIIECPKNCPANVYKPICSRGKSYANLCVLKQEICKKNIPTEVYQDIEACPGYDKLEDETGASVEAVDKNGVIFRSLFDDSTNTEKIPMPSAKRNLPKRKLSAKTKCTSYRARYRRLKAILCDRQCPSENNQSPVCILGIRYENSCAVKHLVCTTRLPLSAIFLMEPCRTLYSEESDESEDNGPLEHWMNQFDLSMLGHRQEENRTVDTTPRNVPPMNNSTKNCKQDCDPNEYDPICIKDRAFSNACNLRNAICDQQIDAALLKFVTKCQAFNAEKEGKTNHGTDQPVDKR